LIVPSLKYQEFNEVSLHHLNSLLVDVIKGVEAEVDVDGIRDVDKRVEVAPVVA